MTFASRGSFGTAVQTISGATITFQTSLINLNVNDVCFLIVGSNNINTTDANHNEVTTITDSAGNTWEKLAEYTNGQGAAAAGVTCALWMSKLTSPMNIGTFISVDFAAAITCCGVVTWAFSSDAATSLELAAADVLAQDAADLGNITLNPGVSREYIFIRGVAQEGSISTFTETTNYTEIPFALANTGGSADTFINTCGEFRILTGTISSSDPATGSALDCVSVFAAIYETALSGTANATRSTIKTPLSDRKSVARAGITNFTVTSWQMPQNVFPPPPPPPQEAKEFFTFYMT